MQEPIAASTSADGPSVHPGADGDGAIAVGHEAEQAKSRGIGALRTLVLAISFAATLCVPALSIGVLLAIKPLFPLSPQPVGAFVFVLAFSYLMSCLLAIGELTARPLTPRSRSHRPRASVFFAGIALALAAPAIVVVTAPYVSHTLLGKGIICLQAALCAGAFSACLTTSIRLYRTSAKRSRSNRSSAPASDRVANQESCGTARAKPFPAGTFLRIQNGFDRGTARSLIGIGLVSCATGIAIMFLLSPNTVGAEASYSVGIALLALSILLGVPMVRSGRWTKLALGQWIGLLAGSGLGYCMLAEGSLPARIGALVLAIPPALSILGLALPLFHPPHRDEEPGPVMHPLPKPIVTAEQFCSEAARQFGLTPREGETLLLALDNLNAQEIADELGVSPKTAKSYLRKICRKIGAHDIDEAVDALDLWWRNETA